MATIESSQGRNCDYARLRHTRGIALFFAVTAFISCAQRGMTDAHALTYAKAKSSYLQGDYEKAAELIDKGRFDLRSSHQAFLLEAKCEFFLLRPDRAEAILRRLIKRYPRYAEAELYLCRSLLAEGRFDQAQTELEGALRWNPDDPRLLALVGSLHESRREYQKAFEYYARSCGFADELAKSEISLAELYWRFDQGNQARDRVRLAKAMVSPESVLALPLGELESRMAQGDGK